MYKVFIEQKQVWITELPVICDLKCEIISDKYFVIDSLIDRIFKLPKQRNVNCLVIIVNDASEYWKKLKKAFKYQKAAGGVIENEKGEILFIYRNKKWDLPKGKAEPGEKAKETALREIEEECGVKGHKIEKKLISTYHVYQRKGNIYLKKTSWFKMSANKEQNLVPQLEEGITKVEWLKKSDMAKVKRNTYSSIKRLLKSIDLY